ncbi:MAG: hypothetical protein OXU81_09410 [Gammaproteobacteria bacterium]|nr:hypothetical protein [Gammaproteobacteria bacterium]
MIDPTRDRKKEASDHALATGGVPIDPYPGYLNWFFRECVEVGAASGLDRMCRRYPARENEILEAWCSVACDDEQLWAWHEARSRLEYFVERGLRIPTPLARFAIEPAPRAKRGPDPEGPRSVAIECMVRLLQAEHFEPSEVNAQFGASFPSPGRQDPGSTLRKRRARGRPFVAPAFEDSPEALRGLRHSSRPRALECDWADPVEAALVLLASGWPAFALLWECWPEHHSEHLALWCGRAERDAWVWDELRALWNHAVYCGWPMPPRLRSAIAIRRPTDPPGRPAEHGRWVRAAIVETQVALVIRSRGAARRVLAKAFERARAREPRAEHLESSSSSVSLLGALGLDLDDSRVRRNLISGREQLRGVSACSL